VNSLVKLWKKGHSPNVEDVKLSEAIQTMGMLETGIAIDQSEIPAWEAKTMQLVKSKVDNENRQKFAEQVV